MIQIHNQREHQQQHNHVTPDDNGPLIPAQPTATQRGGAIQFDQMFDELNQYYTQQQQQPQQLGLQGEHMRQIRIQNAVQAELTLYQQEKPIRLYQLDCINKFNCPFNWWKIHENKFPTLSHLAYRILSIPATSAPSERVFSNAGITIAKDRTWLSPDTAAELIFLKQAIPALKTYEDSLL